MKLKLEKLKKFRTGSFALWPFDKTVNIKELHNKVVIIGLNPSAKINFGENFHKNRKFDHWYEAVFRKSPFRGAYMTDLISEPQSKSLIILKKWRNNKFRKKNVENLKKQFKILGVKNTTSILCIGQNTVRLFCLEFSRFAEHVHVVSHPNSYRVKNSRRIFLNDARKIGREISRTI